MSNNPSILNEEKIDIEPNMKKRFREYFEICKRNINSEKKKKYEINEKTLDNDLQKKVLLELKYHELSNTIGWIQLSIIVASTAITFIQTVDGLYEMDQYIVSIVIISLSTYVALILAIFRFFKLDEQKELIVNLLSTYATYINKLKARQHMLIDHQFDYYKRDIDYEYNEWNKLKDVFARDGSLDLKISINNEIDMLLTKKDILKYKEEILRLDLQEFIITEQNSIYSKVEPLMFGDILKYKWEWRCFNHTWFRCFDIKKFHREARELYSDQEINKIKLGNIIDQKNSELNKIDDRIKSLIYDNHKLKKYYKALKISNPNEENQIKNQIESLMKHKDIIRTELNEIKKDDKKKAIESYKTNQTVELINRDIINNKRIESDLGIRTFNSYNSKDIKNKYAAMRNYNHLNNHGLNHKLESIDDVDIEDSMYYPDEFYGIYNIKIDNNNKMHTYKQYYNGSNSSYSYSSDDESAHDNIDTNINKSTKRTSVKVHNNFIYKDNSSDEKNQTENNDDENYKSKIGNIESINNINNMIQDTSSNTNTSISSVNENGKESTENNLLTKLNLLNFTSNLNSKTNVSNISNVYYEEEEEYQINKNDNESINNIELSDCDKIPKKIEEV